MTAMFDAYHRDIHRCLNIMSRIPDEERFIAIRLWYQTGGREQFAKVFQHETGSRLIESRADGQRVELGIFDGPKDEVAKVKDPKFYQVHAEWFIATIDSILAADNAYRHLRHDFYFLNLNSILQTLLSDRIVLLEDFAAWHQKVPGVFGIVKNRRERNGPLYNGALQAIFGNYSPLSSPIISTDMAISALRMNIEMRLRWGFGALGIYDQTGNSFKRLDLSTIIASISKHQRNITLGRPLSHINRIYRWANLYVHGGFRLYTWCAPALLRYLRPFLVDGTSSEIKSIYAGIQTSTATLLDVQQSIRSACNLTENLVLITYPPDACELILTDA